MNITSVAYRNGRGLGEVALDDIGEAMKQPDTFVRLDLHEPDDALLLKIQEEFGLHELSIEDARHAHQRPKIEADGDSLFIVLKTARLAQGQVLYGEAHFFVGQRFLVSVRHGASSGGEQAREHGEMNPNMLAKGPGFALYAALDAVVDDYQPIVAQFESEFDAIETDIFKDTFDRLIIERLYDLKRKLVQLRNAALPVTDISAELIRLHEGLMPKELRPYLRDVQDHVARVVGLVDGMREMLTTAMQVNLALVAHNQNEVVKRLAGWGAILAIPTVVFSLYGMNFKWMPELTWKSADPMAVAATLLGCIYVHRRLRRAGWV
jgi:magnesium transporter